MAKTSRPGHVPGHQRSKGRPRVLCNPVSVRVDIEVAARDRALELLPQVGADSFAELLRAALDFYINHHATNN